jgi:hypothetical protein
LVWRTLTHPIHVHVGHDEVLLDDSVHGFIAGVGPLATSTKLLDLIGEFPAECLASAPKS